jgi:hypothetical protein
LGAWVLADDEEYSVIAKSDVRAGRLVRTVATWVVWWVFFEAALADAPASARPDTSSAVARTASVPAMVALYIAVSIWFETTQTEQTWKFGSSKDLEVEQTWKVSYSTTLFGVVLSLPISMIVLCWKRNNQSSNDRKIGKTIGR